MEVNGGKVVYEVGTDDTELNKGLEKSMGSIGKFAAKAVALLGLGAMFHKGTEYAIDMGENFEALERQVGSSAEKIKKWSEDASDALGITQGEALKTANTFSGMFKNMAQGDQSQAADMVMEFQQRVADLSEYLHVDGQELTDTFQGLFATGRAMNPVFSQLGLDLTDTAMQTKLANGEFESMGLTMDQTWTQVDASTQAMIRYKLLMEGTTDSIGAFKKNAGSAEQNIAKFKNSMTQLSGALATGILPVLNAILPVIEMMANFLEKNTWLVWGLIGAWAGFKAAKIVASIASVIPSLLGMAVAETAAESGPAAPFTIPATVAAIAAGMGAIGFAYAFGSASGPAKGAEYGQGKNETHVIVNIDPITGRTTSNSNNSNIQTNVGRGGS